MREKLDNAKKLLMSEHFEHRQLSLENRLENLLIKKQKSRKLFRDFCFLYASRN